MLLEREKDILNIIIKEYVKRAKPISSDYLKKRYKLDVCPATIRNDMHRLSEKGYLSQFYISGGRVPTSKAYKMFAEEVLENLSEKSDFLSLVEQIHGSSENDFEFISLITKSLADYSCSFAFTYYQNHSYKEGWKQIIQNPEFSKIKALKNFLRILDELEENIEELIENDFKIKVYIGKEKDINLKDFSLIVGQTVFPENQKGILALIGPDRTDYTKNIEIMNSLIKALEKT
ncbi:MAG: hypothetical protein PHN37_00155 [Candidatus Pacebacteria bacterium]|nr:hypothetical protein [Candidatus Paceibacterota bacterium]